jgi:hypothetical protein
VRELSTDQKGAIVEAEIAAVATKLGIGVSQPLGDERYDLILDLRPELLRVQCKWAVRRGDVVVINCRRSRRGREGLIQRRYELGEIDAIAAYCAELDKCYLLPLAMSVGRTGVSLRLGPTRNNQQRLVNWAKDFEFAATLSAPGPIAQLGERLRGTQEAGGSSPPGSINSRGQRALPV